MMNRKRTKIVATISDKRCEPEFIRALFEAGMDVVRINSAHLDIEGAVRIIRNTRQVSDRIAIMIDTKGPEIRTTLCDAPIYLKKGEIVKITGEPAKKTERGNIFVTYPDFALEIPEGSSVLIDDGEIELKVTGKKGNSLECAVINDGVLGSRKSVNVPSVKINLPSVTPKDRLFIEMAIKEDIEFIAHSFVRSRQDILDVKAILEKGGSEIKIIAKIENQEGVDNIDEILDEAYGIMVARGDLAIEIPYEKVPGIQRMIIDKCIIKRKPVIVATQMLQTMINNPRPTRAEVNDIASAIYSHTDAMMLSGETASGKYPVEAVRTMTKVAMEVENDTENYLDIPSSTHAGEISGHLARIAVETSAKVGAKGIIADTVEGRTIRDMAAFRGKSLILAQCYRKRTMRELALLYGVYADYQEKKKSVDMFIYTALEKLTGQHNLQDDDIVIILAGNFSAGRGFSFIEVGTLDYLKNRVTYF